MGHVLIDGVPSSPSSIPFPDSPWAWSSPDRSPSPAMDAGSSRAPPPLTPRRGGTAFQPLTSLSSPSSPTHSRRSSGAPRRKAQSAWSSRSSSPTRLIDDSLNNRPRSKSTASLSAYFNLPAGPNETEEYDFPPTDATESSGFITFDSGSHVPVFSPSGVPRVRSLTDVNTLTAADMGYPPRYTQPTSPFGPPLMPSHNGMIPPRPLMMSHPTTMIPNRAPVPNPAPMFPSHVGATNEQWRMGIDEMNRKLGLLNRQKRNVSTYDTETETEPLPTARIPPPPKEKPPLARRLVPVFMFFCRGLSIVPAAIGTIYHLHMASVNVESRGPGVPNALDHIIVSFWSIATAAWCYLLASGLLRRWLTYYPLFPTLIRQLSLQAICWSSTHITIQLFGSKCPLIAWVVIGSTTSVSNGVQIWVTSNIRLASKDEEKSKRWFAVGMGLDYWLGKRKMDWAKVVRQCLIPLFCLYFVTTWALLIDREFVRGK